MGYRYQARLRRLILCSVGALDWVLVFFPLPFQTPTLPTYHSPRTRRKKDIFQISNFAGNPSRFMSAKTPRRRPLRQPAPSISRVSAQQVTCFFRKSNPAECLTSLTAQWWPGVGRHDISSDEQAGQRRLRAGRRRVDARFRYANWLQRASCLRCACARMQARIFVICVIVLL